MATGPSATPPGPSNASTSSQNPLNVVLQAITEMRSTQTETTARLEQNMEDKLAQFRKELVEKQEASCERLERKMKSGAKEAYTFKRTSYEQQHKFNNEVREKIDGAVESLEESADSADPTSSLERAKRSLTEGKELIAGRQKLLKIAGRSEGE